MADWIQRMSSKALLPLVREFLKAAYGELVDAIHDEILCSKIEKIKPELKTIQDSVELFRFYFRSPRVTENDILGFLSPETYEQIRLLVNPKALCEDPASALKSLKKQIEGKGISMQDIYHFLRFALMGNLKGPSIPELIEFLGTNEALERVKIALNFTD